MRKRTSTADVHDKAIRDKSMRAIATHSTTVKKCLANVLTKQGVTSRVQGATLPGHPDSVVDDYHCVIFTHDCFWYHRDRYLFKVPAARTEFQLEEIGKNVQCDARDCGKLQALDWHVLIIWECALCGHKKLSDEALSKRVIEWVCGGGDTARIDTLGTRLL